MLSKNCYAERKEGSLELTRQRDICMAFIMIINPWDGEIVELGDPYARGCGVEWYPEYGRGFE